MRIGDNEKIILSLMKKYKKYNERELHLLFLSATQKKARVDVILHSLRVKGILNNNINKPDFSIIDNIELQDIMIPKEVLENLEHLVHPIKMGNLAKSILYLILKTEKCSLQFLSMFFKESTNNTYAILQRLEEKNFVTSYHSRIRHVDANGRKYNPKYYILTELGKTWLLVHRNEKLDISNIHKTLKKLDNATKQIITFSGIFLVGMLDNASIVIA